MKCVKCERCCESNCENFEEVFNQNGELLTGICRGVEYDLEELIKEKNVDCLRIGDKEIKLN